MKKYFYLTLLLIVVSLVIIYPFKKSDMNKPTLADYEYPHNFIGPIREGDVRSKDVIAYEGELYWRFVEPSFIGPLVPGQEYTSN